MKILKLSKSYLVHDGEASEVTFREPKFKDVMEFGEIYAFGKSPDGTKVSALDYVAIQAYAGRLVQAPFNDILLEQLNVADTKRVIGVIVDFFTEQADGAKSATISPSASDGTLPASKE